MIVSVRAEKTTVQIRNLRIDFLTSKLTLTARLIGIQKLKEQRLEGIVIIVAACLYRVESKHTFGNQRNSVFALFLLQEPAEHNTTDKPYGELDILILIGNAIEVEFLVKAFAVALTANKLGKRKSNLVIKLLIDYLNGETVDKLVKRVHLAFANQEIVCGFSLCTVTQAIRISARIGENLNYLVAVKLVLTCQERETIIAAICIRKCNHGIIHAKPSQNTEHFLRNRYTAVLCTLVEDNLIYVYVALIGVAQLLNRCEDRILKVHVVLVRSEVGQQKLVHNVQEVIDVVFLFQYFFGFFNRYHFSNPL